jgi:hypothetical protein
MILFSLLLLAFHTTAMPLGERIALASIFGIHNRCQRWERKAIIRENADMGWDQFNQDDWINFDDENAFRETTLEESSASAPSDELRFDKVLNEVNDVADYLNGIPRLFYTV